MYDCKIKPYDTTERCVADCDCKYENKIDGYVGVLTRWREKDARWGAAPPATPSMVKEGVAFSLAVKAKQAKVPQAQWDAHVDYMRSNKSPKVLASYYLDYIEDYDAWEVARTQK